MTMTKNNYAEREALMHQAQAYAKQQLFLRGIKMPFFNPKLSTAQNYDLLEKYRSYEALFIQQYIKNGGAPIPVGRPKEQWQDMYDK